MCIAGLKIIRSNHCGMHFAIYFPEGLAFFFFFLPCLVGNVDRIRSQLAFHKRRCPCQSVSLCWRRSLINEATPLWRLLQLGRRWRELQLCYSWNGQVKGMTGELVFELSTEETQNTHEIKRTLYNWTKQDKTCKFSKSFSKYIKKKGRRKTNN